MCIYVYIFIYIQIYIYIVYVYVYGAGPPAPARVARVSCHARGADTCVHAVSPHWWCLHHCHRYLDIYVHAVSTHWCLHRVDTSVSTSVSVHIHCVLSVCVYPNEKKPARVARESQHPKAGGEHNHRFLKNNQKGTRGCSRLGCATRLSPQMPLIIFLCPREKQNLLQAM